MGLIDLKMTKLTHNCIFIIFYTHSAHYPARNHIWTSILECGYKFRIYEKTSYNMKKWLPVQKQTLEIEISSSPSSNDI